FLREFPSSLSRADILLIKDDRGSFYYDLSKIKNGSPHITIHSYQITPDGIYSVEDGQALALDHFQDKKTLAFCGIAKPERFFSLLNELGINPTKTLIYPDHHLYPDSSLNQILETARREGLSAFITTEKDAVKIRQTRLSREHLSGYLKIVMKIQKDFFDSLWSKLENVRDERS
ncbi:MAG: tetraacyldisaccharide 4'-kinase, partial [Candidatus Aminicenantes bacterium]|nr:tetraacyldisaccharide 4'-kinase [Candidatus Aminicenantes bacterium]